jgi:prefoldin beta subunit
MVQEQLAKLQQTQQNFQSIIMQKQQVESEKLETGKALEELKKASDDELVFKHAGTIMIKSNKKDLIEELEEQVELAKTKASILVKQEERLKTTLKEQETKIQEMIQNSSTNTKLPK